MMDIIRINKGRGGHAQRFTSPAIAWAWASALTHGLRSGRILADEKMVLLALCSRVGPHPTFRCFEGDFARSAHMSSNDAICMVIELEGHGIVTDVVYGHGVFHGVLQCPASFMPDLSAVMPAENVRRSRMLGARRMATHTRAQWDALRYFCGACVACGEGSPDRVGKDHIKPVALGGYDGITNIQPMCRSCNSRKGTQEWGDLRPDGWLAAVSAVDGDVE